MAVKKSTPSTSGSAVKRTRGAAKNKFQEPPKRKRLLQQEVVSRTGVTIADCYCRRCMKTKSHINFYEALDNGLLDANGKMSVCKDCCNEIYDNFFKNYNSIEKALLKTCRVLNIKYDEKAISLATEKSIKMMENDKEVVKFFSIYKLFLMQIGRGAFKDGISVEGLTFVEPEYNIVGNPYDDDSEEAHDLRLFWGENLEYDDYAWLEKELSEWKKTHKSDTKAEETLLKEICYKGLEIRNARRDGKLPGALVKEYQELMKTANVDPSKTNIAGSGKSQDTFSAFIKTIESTEPAEYFEDKKLFKDFDNIDFYFKKYITRPLKNFITQSRDFNVDAESDMDEFEDFDIQEAIKDEH